MLKPRVSGAFSCALLRAFHLAQLLADRAILWIQFGRFPLQGQGFRLAARREISRGKIMEHDRVLGPRQLRGSFEISDRARLRPLESNPTPRVITTRLIGA